MVNENVISAYATGQEKKMAKKNNNNKKTIIKKTINVVKFSSPTRSIAVVLCINLDRCERSACTMYNSTVYLHIVYI